MITLTEMPPAIAALPRDDRGYPVPWFVAWPDGPTGKPEFRCMDGKKLRDAIKDKRCWVCGEPLDPKQHVFVIGPMCSINRISAEPPSHAECAEFSVRNCPFLTRPAAVRRDANLPEDSTHGAGIMIARNPGVTLLWYCRGYKLMQDGSRGVLFQLPGASQVRFFREGRKATRSEILDSIETGLPILQKVAAEDGADALECLQKATKNAMKLIPAA